MSIMIYEKLLDFFFFYGLMGHVVEECGDGVHASESCEWGDWLKWNFYNTGPWQASGRGGGDRGSRTSRGRGGRGRGFEQWQLHPEPRHLAVPHRVVVEDVQAVENSISIVLNSIMAYYNA
jgi:hypothetical protein